MAILLSTYFPDLKLAARGKVRDIYDLGETLLIVTTDRISAFDVIMNEGIPDKGYVLTQISAFWFRQMEEIIPNHIISTDVNDFPAKQFSILHRGQFSKNQILSLSLTISTVFANCRSSFNFRDNRRRASAMAVSLKGRLS